MRSLSLLLLLTAPTFAADKPAVITSAKSGLWTSPTTWSTGKVPTAGDRVLIRSTDSITYDGHSKDVIRGLCIAGALRFDTAKDTRLEVGLIAIRGGDEYYEEGFDCEAHVEKPQPGKPRPTLEIGTPNAPVAKDKTALIRLHYMEGMNKESCPAIVCCGGRWDAHGQPMTRTWLKLSSPAKAGDSSVTLSDATTGWNVGDRVVLTGTSVHGLKANESYSEENTITAIDGPKLTLEQPLKQPHAGAGEYRGEVANLTRNVVIESADPAGVRGHTMYHCDSAGSLSYAEFRHLGKKNLLGRYALHYHLVGDSMRGSSAIGLSIHDSDNRFFTIHGTNYLVVRDVVGYRSIGHGFFLEDGTEVDNVLDRNLAIAVKAGKKLPKQVLPFDQNNGAGFWWTNSLNSFTRNVAAECDQYGFRYEATPGSGHMLDFKIRQPDGTSKKVDVRTLPFVRFDDNEVHSSHGLYGVNLGEGVNRVGPDARHPFVVRNLKVWDVHYGFRPQVPNLLVENLHLDHVAYGVYHPNFDNHVYRKVYIGHTGTEPFNRGHDDDSVQYGVLTVDGLTFDGCRSGGMPLIQISDNNPTGNAVTHMRNVKTTNWSDNSKQKAIVNLGGGPRPTPKTEKGVPIYLHDYYGPGRHAMVASTKSGEYKANAAAFHSEVPLTGNESQVKEVKEIAFPEVLTPVDDLPPTTVITHVTRDGPTLIVRGVTADNGMVVKVMVNGRPARSTAANYSEWLWVMEGITAGEVKLQASAEDTAGNAEKTPMVLIVR
ncbi:hypothetical protein BH11PLA2_BH11PLA2_09930 [soil metagenome]